MAGAKEDNMEIIKSEEQAKKYFGEKAKDVWHKAEILKSWCMDTAEKYKGCYRSPDKPKSLDYRGKLPVPQGSCYLNEFLNKVYKPWKEAHSEEIAKEEADKKRRDDEFFKMRNSIFGIAGSLNLFVTWKGDDKNDCKPDVWYIYSADDVDNGPIAIMEV